MLVDSARDHDERALMHAGCQRLVLDQLDSLIFVYDRALADGNVTPNLERLVIALRNLAAADIAEQVLHPGGKTLALGVQHPLLRLRVESKKIRWRRGVDKLRHRELDPVARLLVALHRVGEFAH